MQLYTLLVIIIQLTHCHTFSLNSSHAAISIGFSNTQYSIQENVGIFHPGPVTILKENFVTSEQHLSVFVTFVVQTATPGATILANLLWLNFLSMLYYFGTVGS